LGVARGGFRIRSSGYARIEYHASHDGWHCHWKTGELVDIARGAVKAAGRAELRRDCGGKPLSISKNDAFGVAFQMFNVHSDSGLFAS